MTITPTRLRELVRFADDRAADTAQDYQTIQAHRDIAAALRESTTMIEELDGYAASDRIKSENLRLADTELSALRDVREVLKREVQALKAENTRLRQALKTLHKNPDDCTDPDDGMCVSHAAYLELVEQIEAAGWRWDDDQDCWVSPLKAENERLRNGLEHIAGSCGGRAAEVAHAALATEQGNTNG